MSVFNWIVIGDLVFVSVYVWAYEYVGVCNTNEGCANFYVTVNK